VDKEGGRGGSEGKVQARDDFDLYLLLVRKEGVAGRGGGLGGERERRRRKNEGGGSGARR